MFEISKERYSLGAGYIRMWSEAANSRIVSLKMVLEVGSVKSVLEISLSRKRKVTRVQVQLDKLKKKKP